MIQALAAGYKEAGFRFYFIDERGPGGKSLYGVHGDAHAEEFMKLTELEEQGPILHTFVQKKGYVAFEGDEHVALPVVWMKDAVDTDPANNS